MDQAIALTLLKSGHNVFMTGSAGTGKTYLLNTYVQYLKERKIYPTIVAPTGIAASHLGGQTIHSFFSLGIRDDFDDFFIDSLTHKKYLVKRFTALKVLIVDEVSMISPEIFTAMDKILQAFKESSLPFGGVQVILSGDFFQLPPVSREVKEKRFAWQSPSWKALDLKTCYLQKKFRQDDDKLISVLDDIRSGNITATTHDVLNERMHTPLNVSFTPTKLYTHNMDVDRINQNELNELPTAPKTFTATTVGSAKNIERVFKTALVLESLTLKKDAVVIFIKNNHEVGYVNGTTGVVVGFEDTTDKPMVELASGQVLVVDDEVWSIENDKDEVIAKVTQTPLRLAWALTIHKSQGMTLDAAEIDLSKTFETGQGYVALSRLKSIEGLMLMGLNEKALQVDPLILHIDEHIKRASSRSVESVESLTTEILDKAFHEHIVGLGGLVDTNAIADEKEKLSHEKNVVRSSGVANHLQTKKMIDDVANIEELAAKRGLTIGTITKHLALCLEDDKELNLDKFKPDEALLVSIRKLVETIEAEKKEENFTEKGLLKLKPIHEALDGTVSYDTLRLALMFV